MSNSSRWVGLYNQGQPAAVTAFPHPRLLCDLCHFLPPSFVLPVEMRFDVPLVSAALVLSGAAAVPHRQGGNPLLALEDQIEQLEEKLEHDLEELEGNLQHHRPQPYQHRPGPYDSSAAESTNPASSLASALPTTSLSLPTVSYITSLADSSASSLVPLECRRQPFEHHQLSQLGQRDHHTRLQHFFVDACRYWIDCHPDFRCLSGCAIPDCFLPGQLLQ